MTIVEQNFKKHLYLYQEGTAFELEEIFFYIFERRGFYRKISEW